MYAAAPSQSVPSSVRRSASDLRTIDTQPSAVVSRSTPGAAAPSRGEEHAAAADSWVVDVTEEAPPPSLHSARLAFVTNSRTLCAASAEGVRQALQSADATRSLFDAKLLQLEAHRRTIQQDMQTMARQLLEAKTLCDCAASIGGSLPQPPATAAALTAVATPAASAFPQQAADDRGAGPQQGYVPHTDVPLPTDSRYAPAAQPHGMGEHAGAIAPLGVGSGSYLQEQEEGYGYGDVVYQRQLLQAGSSSSSTPQSAGPAFSRPLVVSVGGSGSAYSTAAASDRRQQPAVLPTATGLAATPTAAYADAHQQFHASSPAVAARRESLWNGATPRSDAQPFDLFDVLPRQRLPPAAAALAGGQGFAATPSGTAFGYRRTAMQELHSPEPALPQPPAPTAYPHPASQLYQYHPQQQQQPFQLFSPVSHQGAPTGSSSSQQQKAYLFRQQPAAPPPSPALSAGGGGGVVVGGLGSTPGSGASAAASAASTPLQRAADRIHDDNLAQLHLQAQLRRREEELRRIVRTAASRPVGK